MYVSSICEQSLQEGQGAGQGADQGSQIANRVRVRVTTPDVLENGKGGNYK